MSSAIGNRSPRAGAHRAPRAGLPVRIPRTSKARDGDGKTGIFGVRFRSRKSIARASAVLLLGVLVGVGIANGGASSAEPTVYQFLLDWEQGQYQQAAGLTTGVPHTVANELAAAYRQVDATHLVLSMGRVRQHGGTATAAFRASIELGSIGLDWQYGGKFGLRQIGSGWKVVWSPGVILPGLQHGQRLGVVLEPQPRAMIYSASGQPLLVPGPTYEIGVIPGRLHGAEITETADSLAALEPGLPASQLAGQIEASETNAFHNLVTLSPTEYARVASRIRRIPGLVVVKAEQPLFVSIAPDVTGVVGTEISSVLRTDGSAYLPGTTVGLSGLEETFNRELTGTPTSGVYVQSARGSPLYYAAAVGGRAVWLGQKPKAVYTTLDAGVQAAANNALAQLPDSAAIVAVQASTGKILAVASHQSAGLPALDPLDGSYEPGQAFTIVSSAAILATGQVGLGSPEDCWARNYVNGRAFVNVPPEPGSLAQSSTVSKDFAVGCSTAFAGLSELLHAGGALTSTAQDFGIGVPWQLPLPQGSYSTGSIAQPAAPDQVAADAIGQGSVRVSPLSMALVAAAADSGRWQSPSLVLGPPDPVAAPKTAMSAQVLSEVQSLMREAVAHGAGSAANVDGDVYGQVGSAPFSGTLRIDWFVGYQGNIAFAVAELAASPTNYAASLAGSFLRNIHAGS